MKAGSFFPSLKYSSLFAMAGDDCSLFFDLKNLTEKQKEWYIPYQNYEMALLNFYQGDYNKTLDLVKKTIIEYSGELDIILGNAYLFSSSCSSSFIKLLSVTLKPTFCNFFE